MNTKICTQCNIEKEVTNFYKRKNRDNQYVHYCISCTKIQTNIRLKAFKMQCLNYKQTNKCISCGYDKYTGALEFHHIDPNEKEFNIQKAATKKLTDSIKKELDKCIVLCANCHREIHSNILIFENNEIKFQNEETLIWNKPKNLKSRLDFEQIAKDLENNKTLKEIANTLNITNTKYYLKQILSKNGIILPIEINQNIGNTSNHAYKINWPLPEEMSKLVYEKPTSQLAKELGVSDVAIAKFCKKHNIQKPSRGHWTKVN